MSVTLVCVVEWIRWRAVWSHCARIQLSPDSISGMGTANQAISSSKVGKWIVIRI